MTGKLINTFHRTEVTIRVPQGYTPDQWWKHRDEQAFVHRTPADVAWVRKVSNALCGMQDCCCGTVRN